jgi:hypothetical protein
MAVSVAKLEQSGQSNTTTSSSNLLVCPYSNGLQDKVNRYPPVANTGVSTVYWLYYGLLTRPFTGNQAHPRTV